MLQTLKDDRQNVYSSQRQGLLPDGEQSTVVQNKPIPVETSKRLSNIKAIMAGQQ
jgi:hypothetical protein